MGQSPEAQDQSHARTHRQEKSVRWLENLRQATALLNKPVRCVHIGDRESDIYKLFCLVRELGTHFLVRTCADWFAGERGRPVSEQMWRVPVQGRHRL